MLNRRNHVSANVESKGLRFEFIDILHEIDFERLSLSKTAIFTNF